MDLGTFELRHISLSDLKANAVLYDLGRFKSNSCKELQQSLEKIGSTAHRTAHQGFDCCSCIPRITSFTTFRLNPSHCRTFPASRARLPRWVACATAWWQRSWITFVSSTWVLYKTWDLETWLRDLISNREKCCHLVSSFALLQACPIWLCSM